MQIECKAGRETVKAETGTPSTVGGSKRCKKKKKKKKKKLKV